jgi:hypothetical protein
VISRRVLPLIVAALAGSVVSGREPQAPFRSVRTVVSVNVTVTGWDAAVPLMAADFVLTDNGVRQTIDALTVEAVPIDATLILDTSGSAAGGIRQLLRDAEAFAAQLQPVDRFRLLTIDTYVNEILPLRPSARPVWPARIPGNGASAVYDALATALLLPPAPDRRQLIVALTDGMDTTSALDLASVREVASRSDALLHIVIVSLPPADPPVPPNWLPRRERNLEMLEQTAARTGGQLREAATLGRSVAEALTAVLEEFHGSYVLRYSPVGVARGGWHTLEVKLARGGKHKIRARQGYFGG